VAGRSDFAPALDRLLAERQADRLPSVAAAVTRKGEPVWSGAVGSANYAEHRDATPETQYRIGSITKTFTAVAVMQQRAEGKLDLDDRLDQHLDGIVNGSPTIRRLLCHLSGLQREAGEMFVTGESPTEAELIASMRDAEFVLRPGESHHYSNLAFALLGQVVVRTSGQPYMTYVNERILTPLRLERTTWTPHAPAAQGYLVDEYARTVWVEAETEMGGTAAAGQLWSTVGDLGRWAAFLAAGNDEVLAANLVEEMWFPQVMYDPSDWALAWGLGLMLYNQGGRIYAGHGGAMAGHLAGVCVDRATQTGAAALTNSGTRGNMELFAVSLAAKAIELWPPAIAPWQPEADPPDDVRPLLGRWWSEGNEFIFWWQDATLRARVAAAPPGKGETTFTRDGDTWLAAKGRERGERLRRDGDRLIWAGYAFTRAQEPFSAV
jgi:CubicO group peptidase (beta-lactamase class C family)